MADDTKQPPKPLHRMTFREIQREILTALPDATPANEVIHPNREY